MALETSNKITEDNFVYSDAFQIHIKIPVGMNDGDLKQQILSALKLQELLKEDMIPNLKSLIHSITKCAGDYDEVHAKRYEEEIFAFLDEVQSSVKDSEK